MWLQHTLAGEALQDCMYLGEGCYKWICDIQTHRQQHKQCRYRSEQPTALLSSDMVGWQHTAAPSCYLASMTVILFLWRLALSLTLRALEHCHPGPSLSLGSVNKENRGCMRAHLRPYHMLY
jgi:hypothetical protein